VSKENSKKVTAEGKETNGGVVESESSSKTNDKGTEESERMQEKIGKNFKETEEKRQIENSN